MTLELQQGLVRRALDRVADLEYYTSEALGPNRERTPEGFLICWDVPVARTGEMVYGPGEVPEELGVGQDGRIKIIRTPDEVFAPKSIASLNGKPVTDDHPPVDVDPNNWRFYTRGVVVNPRRGTDEFKNCLIADMIIFDADTIRDIEMGKREVSCGYNPDYFPVQDEAGNQIRGRGEQGNIIYNHCALVVHGRCGEKCSIQDHKTVDNAGLITQAEVEAELAKLKERTVILTKDFWSARRQRRLARLARNF
jgi:uncharacterized protein